MRLIVIAILASCAPPPTTIANRASAAITTGCPWIGFHGTAWLQEVFPGCPAMPFHYDFPMCAGECPRPCRSRTGNETSTYRYDANGRWRATRSATSEDACEYAGERIASCGDGYEQWQRRGDGRIVAITVGATHVTWMTVRYDERGDAVELTFPGFHTDHRFRYDAEHRILEDASERTTTFTYDHGRLVSRGDAELRSTYGYDDRGRLVRVDNTAWPVGPAPRRVVTLDYDASDRVVRIAEGNQTTTFDYDCR